VGLVHIHSQASDIAMRLPWVVINVPWVILSSWCQMFIE